MRNNYEQIIILGTSWNFTDKLSNFKSMSPTNRKFYATGVWSISVDFKERRVWLYAYILCTFMHPFWMHFLFFISLLGRIYSLGISIKNLSDSVSNMSILQSVFMLGCWFYLKLANSNKVCCGKVYHIHYTMKIGFMDISPPRHFPPVLFYPSTFSIFKSTNSL